MFVTLRDILVELYPDEASARRIVDDAGLDSALISFSTHAKNNWHMILTEADKHGKVEDLLAIALGEYGENPELRNACEANRKLVGQGGRIVPPTQMPVDDEIREYTHSDIPEWFLLAGVAFGALTLLFFMGLVIASLFAYVVPANSTFSVVVVLALGSALATSFLGGWAVAEGRISIPLVQDHPVQFSAGGGIAVLLILVLLGYLFYVVPREPPPPPPLPVVYCMDSKEPEQIYNPEFQGTNTDRIREILRYLPVKPPMEELVHSEWDDAEIMSQLEPDLIIIHYSAFYTSTTMGDPARKLDAFLHAMEDTHTKFLIYSRLSDFEDEEEIKQYYENTYPFLEGRVDALWIPKGEAQNCRYWTCSDTQVRLRDKVKSLLGLS